MTETKSTIQVQFKQQYNKLDTSVSSCRICLKKCKLKCLSLFQPYKNAAVFEHINSITQLNITEGDGYPDKICKHCLLELDVSISFKEKCEISNSYLLQNRGNSFPISVDTSQIKEEPDFDSNETYDYDSFLKHTFDEDQQLKNVIKYTDICKKENKIEVTFPDSGPFKCNDCNGIFRSKCKLRVHWKKVHLPSTMTCQICKRIFKSIYAYKRHQTQISKNVCVNLDEIIVQGEGKNRVFQCVKCDYVQTRYSSLQKHVLKHNGKKPYQCNLCSNAYTQIGTLLSHKETFHDIVRVEITCPYCGKNVKGRRRVYRHLKSHSVERFQCDICKIIVKTKQSLCVHMSGHSGVKSFTCEVCAASFYRSSELCNHRRYVHSKDNLEWYECDTCPYRSWKKVLVTRHKAKHTEDNFACGKCGKFFKSVQRLQKHARLHIVGKRYRCRCCHNMFSTPDSLRKHLKYKHNTTKTPKSDQSLETVPPEDICLSS